MAFTHVVVGAVAGVPHGIDTTTPGLCILVEILTCTLAGLANSLISRACVVGPFFPHGALHFAHVALIRGIAPYRLQTPP